jgi:RNA polymerase sigma-70 factor (ECF subfamily)
MQLAISQAALHLTAEPETTTCSLDEIDALVRTYRPRLLRFVSFSIGDADLAESIVQDCFLKAYNARDSFRGDCSVSTWLFGIANNLIRDHLRTKKFHFWRKVRATAIDVSEMAHSLAGHDRSPETMLLQREMAVQVTQSLARLSVNQRRIFLLRFSEDMSPQEIATLIDMPLNTVKTHLRRALTSVRAQMGQTK